MSTMEPDQPAEEGAPEEEAAPETEAPGVRLTCRLEGSQEWPSSRR